MVASQPTPSSSLSDRPVKRWNDSLQNASALSGVVAQMITELALASVR